ncbi:heavy metal translocating P-type ATPase [Beijerinckia sp. L45]|uniref:heavy metal translocating P-type ATPase n=1 Tax=Beijerinckia sp. L45 TaxID=1641855 RepID=UPI00131A969B|nr:heavy metal translocating P-type ATPase [Beijerinckia sp. L45]
MSDVAMETRFEVGGMDCGGCARKVDTAVRRIPGVLDVSVSVTGAGMTVSHDDTVDLVAIERKVELLGFTARAAAVAGPTSTHATLASAQEQLADRLGHGHDHDHAPMERGPAALPWWRSVKARVTVAAGVAFVAALIAAGIEPQIAAYAFDAAMLVGLLPIARRALAAARSGTPFSIEMLMTIAAVGAAIIGAGEEGAAIVFLFLVGELLEGVAAGKARSGIRSLNALIPKTAILDEDGRTREVPAALVAIGSVILIRPGDRIASDGVIVDGEGSVDEASVTGESEPVAKRPGSTVFAGTINGDGVIRVRATATAADNTIARVVRLVEKAQESKAPTERFIDRFSRYYTPGVVVAAILVAAVPPLFLGAEWPVWIYKGLAILLIGCPCALVISTPAAIASSLAAGARQGLLIKGGAVLETLAGISAVAFDKTGTLTAGKPVVTDVLGFDRSATAVIALAAALEAESNHPLASAILAKFDGERSGLPAVFNASAAAGRGIVGTLDGLDVFFGSPAAIGDVVVPADRSAQIAVLQDEGKTVSVLVVGNVLAGAVAMRDQPRPDANVGLQALRDIGIKIVMLTGDNRRVATAVASDLAIDARSELLPADKQRLVAELQSEGYKVAKVGDGINDAPALAAADVGIAMGGGTDVALETADAATLHGRVADVAAMIALAKRTMRNIRQNVAMALGLKAIFLVTTIVGVTGLWPAILADTGATVLVTMNALRLLAPPRLRAPAV